MLQNESRTHIHLDLIRACLRVDIAPGIAAPRLRLVKVDQSAGVFRPQGFALLERAARVPGASATLTRLTATCAVLPRGTVRAKLRTQLLDGLALSRNGRRGRWKEEKREHDILVRTADIRVCITDQ